MNFVVLSSGRGSRLNKFIKNKPKCLTVIKKNKTLLDYISQNFHKKDNKIISTGYKSNLVEKHLSDKSINYARNENYLKTNMVESLMLCKKKLKRGNLIIVYGDIYFDPKIIKKIRKIKGNVIAVNSNWLKLWKKRFKTLDAIKQDAEDIIVSRNKIKIIGTKIKKKLPKYQYMGIVKIDHQTFIKLERFYKNLKNKKISLTEFINESIKSKITEYKYFASKNYWYEIDYLNDLMCLKKDISKLF